MASVVQQNILWLQVPVDHLEAMKTLERTEQFGSVEAGSVDIKALFSLEVVEQLATIDKCKDKVQLFWRLESELQRHDKWVVDLSKDRSLC